MARANKVQRNHGSKPQPSSHKANAAGYAKRRSQKDKATGLSDVYEYSSSKVRRAKVGLDLDREEQADFGRGRKRTGDEHEEHEGQELKARLIGENGDDEMIDSEDDEDIDSDAAFEESDEEKFSGFNFSRKNTKKAHITTQKPQQRLPEIDLNEDDEDSQPEADSEEVDLSKDEKEGEFFDVLDVFDGKADQDESNEQHVAGKVDRQSPPEKYKQSIDDEEVGRNADEEMDDDQDEDDNEENECDIDVNIELSDAEDTDALEKLETFIQNLGSGDNKKRKHPTDNSNEPERQRKRPLLRERTEAGPEGEFGAQFGGSQKLNLDDLLAPLASSSAALASLKKSTQTLTSSKIAKTLSAPLQQRTQERLDREAAYEQTKAEVDKWSGTMKRIKEAEHLNFPLQAQPTTRPSNLELAAKFKPTTKLENAVDKLLKSAQMREEDITKTEDLKMSHLTVEEVAKRRAELREMRELAFRADVKAKRIAKIKSKTYRRIRKKQRERLDGDDVEAEDDEEANLKREVERARERATLRHKNTGKWAKSMMGKEGLDIDQRREISEMLERGERLKGKIRGDRGSDGGSEDGYDTERGLGLGLGLELELELEDGGDVRDSIMAPGKSKSVFDMKFMRDAAARRECEATEEDSHIDAPVANRNGGRMIFRPCAQDGRPGSSLMSDASSVTLRTSDVIQDPPCSQHYTPGVPTSLPTPTEPAVGSNPWLARASDAHAPRKNNEAKVQKASSSLTKAVNKSKKLVQKSGEEKDRAQEDASLEINVEEALTLPEDTAPMSKSSQPRSTKHEKARKVAEKGPSKNLGAAHSGDEDSDVHSEVEEQERALQHKGKGKGKSIEAFGQRNLVALAFAGDNVVQEFKETKRREIEADAPREIDTALPGWGSWGGTGLKQAPPKPHLIKKIAGVDPTTRADHKKAHVIISEKRDKKAAKYLVKDLPHPYTSHAQFERTMAAPLGAEWNTRVSFQRGTLPRIVKKMGTVIDPLEKVF